MGRKISGITDEERAYICKFYEHDGAYFVGLSLNRRTKEIVDEYGRVNQGGQTNYYKNAWDNQLKVGRCIS